MDGATLAIIVAIGINIIVTAFGAGKLYQKVTNLCENIGRLEKRLNSTETQLDKWTSRLSRLEGKLGE